MTETQWRVVWFPADGPPWQRTRQGTETMVRLWAEDHAADGEAPIIEKREVVVGDWQLVDNLAVKP